MILFDGSDVCGAFPFLAAVQGMEDGMTGDERSIHANGGPVCLWYCIYTG